MRGAHASKPYTVRRMAKVVRLSELERIDVAGVRWRPIRRALGISAFGINAYSADAGEHLIEEHDEAPETGGGAGGHEEVYLVVSGRATFTVAGGEVDAPAGTLVYLDDPVERRSAKALEDGTMAVAIGGRPGAAGPPSAWEFYFAAASPLKAGDPKRAYETTAEGLEHHPEHPALHYNLACYASMAGMHEEALEHLRFSLERDPEHVRKWAAEDRDLDAIRDDPAWPL
jgi:tetratricopeptide (TPR) repeat protein